ncbi:hypothetical protein T03_17694 [Trichinella britovi]|uniref:Uncharacterized protein n=1 Tax=Trichinella britovi TaxID=45882 RepID=A0A0V1CCY3_TRIBR|nr:hypothetical protein T03_17694 [Trichinella britovi]
MRAVYPILQRYVVANRTNTHHVKDVRHGPKIDFSKVYRSIFEVPRQENSEKNSCCRLVNPVSERCVVEKGTNTRGGGLSAIIRLENKLPPAATSHSMNLLTACRCP